MRNIAHLRPLWGPGRGEWAELRAQSITACSGKETSSIIGPRGNILAALLRDCCRTGQEGLHNCWPTSEAIRSHVEEERAMPKMTSKVRLRSVNSHSGVNIGPLG